MRIDIDRYKEILDTLSRNKTRSLLTGFGVFWGVFMLITLLGSGEGLKQKLSKNFQGFATNAAMIWAQNTTKPYQGLRKGRSWSMTTADVERLRQQVPELDVVTPMLSKWNVRAVHDDHTSQCILKGILADYTRVEAPTMEYGRFLNAMDMDQRRKVCVLGKKVYKELFPNGENPCGKYVKINSIYYHVVGVNYSAGNVDVNGSAEETVCIPLSLMQQAYNLGDSVQLICVTGKAGVSMRRIAPKMRAVVARAHQVDPTDDKGCMVFNTEVLYGLLDSMFSGVNFLILLVGIGTLLAGAIGVSNIMMVTVRERTTEIGIRRAIGATPRDILSQIIAESMVLTIVAGMMGILFSVIVLQLLELANTTDGVADANFQIDFWKAVMAVVVLGILGVIAGLAPAWRAMHIKPVDAMRDE